MAAPSPLTARTDTPCRCCAPFCRRSPRRGDPAKESATSCGAPGDHTGSEPAKEAASPRIWPGQRRDSSRCKYNHAFSSCQPVWPEGLELQTSQARLRHRLRHRQRQCRHFPHHGEAHHFKLRQRCRHGLSARRRHENRKRVGPQLLSGVSLGAADVDMWGRLAVSLRTPENCTNGDEKSCPGLPKCGPETGAI